MTGSFPRQRLCQFLPVVARDSEEQKLPVNPTAFPQRVSHRTDARGENFVVEYEKEQLLRNGTKRKSIWYSCCPRGVERGTEAHAAGHLQAEKLAWRHVEAVTKIRAEAKQRGDPGVLHHKVRLKVGLGELSGGEVWCFHGDPHQSHEFCSHQKRTDLSIGSGVWRPARDTLDEGRAHCTSAVFVRRGDGYTVWRCPGHDLREEAAEDPPKADAAPSIWPKDYKKAPLKGLRLVGVFSWVPEEGGAMLSAAWEAAGGAAFRYDHRCDERHDFVSDDAFWEAECEQRCITLPSHATICRWRGRLRANLAMCTDRMEMTVILRRRITICWHE